MWSSFRPQFLPRKMHLVLAKRVRRELRPWIGGVKLRIKAILCPLLLLLISPYLSLSWEVMSVSMCFAGAREYRILQKELPVWSDVSEAIHIFTQFINSGIGLKN
jgi:hypothetical protein